MKQPIVRTFYMDDREVWQKAKVIAMRENTSVSAIISDYLACYVRARLVKKGRVRKHVAQQQ